MLFFLHFHFYETLEKEVSNFDISYHKTEVITREYWIRHEHGVDTKFLSCIPYRVFRTERVIIKGVVYDGKIMFFLHKQGFCKHEIQLCLKNVNYRNDGWFHFF